ncbi:PEGA domain-containing protein [Vibrio sp.]|nr:PEGA domain-containing protein [Vibrio sp.]
MKMNKIPTLLLVTCPIWISSIVQAQEVAQSDPVLVINEKIQIKDSEISVINNDYESQKSALQQLKNEKVVLERDHKELNTKRNRAKTALDKQFNRLLEDPDTDIAAFQKRYQETWAAVKQNKAEQLAQAQEIKESERRLSQIKQKRDRLRTEQGNLQEQKVEARVKRLSAELQESSVVESKYKTTCSMSMTLNECASQGKHLTRQRAVNQFREALLETLTESVLAKRHLKDVQLNIHVQDSQIVNSAFQGQNQYYTQLQAQIKAKPEATAACKLLNVSTRYCLSRPTASKPTKKETKQWANVTVRSDQYDDAVTINGIDYGSTPVEVVLPSGTHQVTVTKDGYESYNRTVTVRGNDTVWVRLQPEKS